MTIEPEQSEAQAMRYSTVRTLIDRGRKAGLKTAELYHALATRPPGAGDQLPGEADGNGYVTTYDPNGQRTYRPCEPLPN